MMSRSDDIQNAHLQFIGDAMAWMERWSGAKPLYDRTGTLCCCILLLFVQLGVQQRRHQAQDTFKYVLGPSLGGVGCQGAQPPSSRSGTTSIINVSLA